MPISPGQRFVRRHDAARTSTPNGTAADLAYDTAVVSEGGYSWSDPEVSVDEAGLYLTLFDAGQVSITSTRAVGTLVPAINGVNQERFRATHRYLRNSGGAQHGASFGAAILDLGAGNAIKVRSPGALIPTDAVGNFATNAGFGGGFQLIRLPDGPFTHLERTVDAAEVGTSNINATRPWLDSSGTWVTITFNSEVRDDAGLYPGSGGDVELEAGKKYAIVYGATISSTDASRHTDVVRLQVGGTNFQTGSGYQRNTASQGPPMCGLVLHETGGSSETLRLQATHEIEGGDAGTPVVSDAFVQIVELPSSAEWIHVDNGAADSLTSALAGTSTWYDTPLSSFVRAPSGGILALDAANNAVQNDSGGSLSLLAIGWHRWDRDAGGSGVRKNPWCRWNNNGVAVGYGVAGAYSRGQQSNDDTWQAHYTSAVTLDLANGADLKFQVNDAASGSNSDMGIYANTNRHFLGVQVLNLASLSESGSIAEADGTAAGGASADGEGSSVAEGDGTADGSASAQGDGASIAEADGTAAGGASADGEGQVGGSVQEAIGTAQGGAAAAGEGAAITEAEGTAAGGASTDGEGSSVAEGDGTADGSASAQAEGASIAETDGTAAGGASADGEGAIAAFVKEAVGTAIAGATATGDGASDGEFSAGSIRDAVQIAEVGAPVSFDIIERASRVSVHSGAIVLTVVRDSVRFKIIEEANG